MRSRSVAPAALPPLGILVSSAAAGYLPFAIGTPRARSAREVQRSLDVFRT